MDKSIVNLLYNAMPHLLWGAVKTLEISICALLVGFLVGILFGIANCRRLRVPYVAPILDLYATIIRGTPIYVQILIVYFALPDLLGINVSPFVAGVIAIGCNSIAYVSEIVRAGINAIPDGQWEACYALGYDLFGALRYVVIPQMFNNVLPALTNELVTLVKETSLLSTIGVIELTKVSRDIIAREMEPMVIYLAAACIYLCITTVITVASKRWERKMSYGQR